jgi:hypothetical protein
MKSQLAIVLQANKETNREEKEIKEDERKCWVVYFVRSH